MKKNKKIFSLKEKLLSVYDSINLKTICCGHCVCCSIACPQMNHSEFLVILDKIYNVFSKEVRVEILKKTIKYFFSQSLVKPCPLLNEKRCSCYEERPLACRLYGLWPEDVYNDRVSKFMSATGLSKEQIPLNSQCTHVKRVGNNEALTKEIIDNLFDKINLIDVSIEKYTPDQVEKRYNQRTFHDWFMVTVFGEQNLSDMSKFLLAAESKEVVDDFVFKMLDQVDLIGDKLFNLKK